jgi:adenylate cyclase
VRLEGSGSLKSHRPIPTGSYRDVYSLPEMPELPAAGADGNIPESADRQEIERWFIDFCTSRGRAAYEAAETELGDAAADEAALIDFMNRNPHSGKYFFYYYFLTNVEARPGALASTYELYPAFAGQVGQDPAFHLNDTQVLSALMEEYRNRFDRYYNKFVFTGATAAGLGDVQQTPYATMFGVNVIINAFNTLATGRPLRLSTHVPRLDFIVLLGASLLFCLLYGLTNVRLSSVIFVVLLISTFIVSLTLFNTRSFFLRTTPLVLSNAVIFVGMVMYKLLTEEKDKKFLKATFKNYLSPELIEAMHESRTMPKLGGEAKVITAYFTDIQSFSTFSEKLTAEQLVELLNEYLSAMTDILIENNGTLDKYEGDAIVAFFGAPVSLPDHAYRACRVAGEMQETLGKLRDKWRHEKDEPGSPPANIKNLPPEEWPRGGKWPAIVHNMRMRIGINTGEIVVGNMGSSMRMNYTMMGDAVNLAARLEAAAKQYGVYTLVSCYTLDTPIPVDGSTRQLRELVETRLIDNITVVGKSEPVKIYELCALKGGLTPEETKLFELFETGHEHYLRMDWDRAIDIFRKARGVERFPENEVTPSDIYLKRCKAYKERPPAASGEEWDGVHRLTEK